MQKKCNIREKKKTIYVSSNDDNGDKHKYKETNDDGDEHKDEEANDDEHKDEETCEVHTKLVADGDTRTPSGTKFRWRKLSRKQIFIMMAINSTYLLSRLNYSLLAPLFPKEVRFTARIKSVIVKKESDNKT